MKRVMSAAYIFIFVLLSVFSEIPNLLIRKITRPEPFTFIVLSFCKNSRQNMIEITRTDPSGLVMTAARDFIPT